MSDLGTLMATLGADLGPLNRSVGAAEGLFRRYEASGQSAFSKVKDSIFSVKGAMVSLAASMGLMKMKDYIVNVSHVAGRYETLGIAMYAAGKNAGYTVQEMDKLESSLKRQGIASNEARESLARMSAAHIDLSKAAKLGRAAQDLAVVGGINSSEAFERLTYAITSAQVVMLRTIGLNVTFEGGYKKTADALGKTVEALTEEEKIQSRVNSVLTAAAAYQGIYEKSMQSAEKQWGSLARFIEEYELAFGKAFQPAFLTIIKAKITLYEKLAQVLSDPKIQKSLSDMAVKFATMYVGFMEKIPEIVKNLSMLVSAFATLAKIAGAALIMRAAFMTLTSVLLASIVAVQTFQLQMGLLRLELIATTGTATKSQMAWAALNTTLWGVGISAQWASGWMAKLKISLALVFAAFAGWEIGKWLSENFETARIAGVWLTDSLIKGWLNVEYGAERVFLWMKKAWTTVIDTLKGMYGTFLEYVAAGLSKMNFTDTADKLRALAKEYKGPSVEGNDQYDKDLAEIENKFKERMAQHNDVITQLQAEALQVPQPKGEEDWIKKMFENAGGAGGGTGGTGGGGGAMSDKLKDALKQINEEIIRSKQSLIGITQGSYAQTLANIEDEAKKYSALGVGKTKIDEYVSARKMEVQAQANKQIEDDIRSTEVNILGYKEGTYAKEMAMLADKAEEYRREGATEEDIARYVALRKEEISVSSTKEKLEAERNLYEDLRGYSGEYFEVTKQLIQEQAREWRALGVSEVAIMAWVKEENTKAFIEMGKKSTEFADGVAAAIEEIRKNMMTMGQAGYEIVNEFSTQASSTLSSLFFDVAKDEFKGFASYFDSFADAMLKKWIDICSQMLVEWILTQAQMKAATGGGGIIGSIFGAVLGAFTGGSSGTVPQLGTPGPGQAIAHMGGKIGYTGFSTRPIDPSVFNGAMRLHNGLRPDEYPFIGQRGETILKKGESLSKGPQVEINVVNQNGSDVSTKDESTFDIVKVKVLIKDAVSEDIMTGGKIHNSFRKKFGISPSIIGR